MAPTDVNFELFLLIKSKHPTAMDIHDVMPSREAGVKALGAEAFIKVSEGKSHVH